MKDQKLRDCIGLGEYELNHRDEYRDDELHSYKTINERLKMLEGAILVVDDYFYKCPCCGGNEKILKSEAVAFKKYYPGGYDMVVGHSDTRYTTKKGAKNHESIIREWADECKKHKKEPSY